MKNFTHRGAAVVIGLAATILLLAATSGAATKSSSYDISTLAGKVASVNGTAGLGIRFSAFIEQEAAVDGFEPLIPDGATVSNGGAGGTILAPDVVVNQDTHAAPQNETSIAVDPNNPNRIVGSANDYVTRTWSCTISGTPCSALGDGYSGTYFSNNGGTTWCCDSSDPSHIGTLIPGVSHLVGGPYDAGGDPAVAFDSHGHVYYAGLGFNRRSAPNTVTVSRGSFDGAGALSWGAPTFINATSSPAIFNDKEWIAADAHNSSPYRDRVYVSWTRFVFSAGTGAYVQSPIAFAYSSDGGQTFSDPQLIAGNVLYGQGSRPVVGPDGTVYVFWDGSTRHEALDSTYMVKSTDGGVTWSNPSAVSTLADVINPANTAFRVNSFPAAAAGPTGDLTVTWTTEVANNATTYGGDANCAYFIVGSPSVRAHCHSVAVYSTSSDGGTSWSAPVPVFAAASRTAVDYPVTQPDTTILSAPSPTGPVEDVFPAVTVTPGGSVYLAAYRGDIVAPWQSCATYDPNGSINCLAAGSYRHNTKLDYVVKKLGGGETTLTTQSINTRYNFRGGFIGDYTDIASGSDERYHALWTDTNRSQNVDWWYGTNFHGLLANQQDVVTRSGN